tara:strand:- start:504 stop:833 length:330 start_codon:yes stop_codon:yes gene_type:complete
MFDMLDENVALVVAIIMNMASAGWSLFYDQISFVVQCIRKLCESGWPRFHVHWTRSKQHRYRCQKLMVFKDGIVLSDETCDTESKTEFYVTTGLGKSIDRLDGTPKHDA